MVCWFKDAISKPSQIAKDLKANLSAPPICISTDRDRYTLGLTLGVDRARILPAQTEPSHQNFGSNEFFKNRAQVEPFYVSKNEIFAVFHKNHKNWKICDLDCKSSNAFFQFWLAGSPLACRASKSWLEPS